MPKAEGKYDGRLQMITTPEDRALLSTAKKIGCHNKTDMIRAGLLMVANKKKVEVISALLEVGYSKEQIKKILKGVKG